MHAELRYDPAQMSWRRLTYEQLIVVGIQFQPNPNSTDTEIEANKGMAR